MKVQITSTQDYTKETIWQLSKFCGKSIIKRKYSLLWDHVEFLRKGEIYECSPLQHFHFPTYFKILKMSIRDDMWRYLRLNVSCIWPVRDVRWPDWPPWCRCSRQKRLKAGEEMWLGFSNGDSTTGIHLVLALSYLYQRVPPLVWETYYFRSLLPCTSTFCNFCCYFIPSSNLLV